MELIEDLKVLTQPMLVSHAFSIRHAIFDAIMPLEAKVVVAKEPVPFDKKAEGLNPIRRGKSWGKLFDCCWFHFNAQIPDGYLNKPLAVIANIRAEGLFCDNDNVALRGISNPLSVANLAEFFNITNGKTLLHLPDDQSKDLELWLEGGYNGVQGYDYLSGKFLRADLAVYHKDIADLYFDYITLVFARRIFRGERKAEVTKALSKSYMKFLKRDIEGARAVLAPILATPSNNDLTVTAVGHSHLDLGWLWPIRETKRKAARTLASALSNMERYPEYVYGASQPQEFLWMKELRPELFARLKEAYIRGQFEPQGGMWVECDTNITGAESLVRQFVYGLRFWKEEFGADIDNCWLPDVFGYSATLPQIIAKCGMHYFMTQKLSWNNYTNFPYETFIWEGLHSDSVITHLLPANSYSSTMAPTSMMDMYRNHKKKCPEIGTALMCYGAGDGGGGPCEFNIEVAKRSANLEGVPKVKMGAAQPLFDELGKHRDKLNRYKGELYLEKHQGTLTTHADVKQSNRYLENALHNYEAISSVALKTGYKFPKEKIDKIWHETMLYQFHDILPGSCIKRVYDEIIPRGKEMVSDLEKEQNVALSALGSSIGLSAFNTSPYPRSEYIKSGNDWYAFAAAPYSAAPLTPQKEKLSGLKVEENCIENDLLKVEFSPEGEIVSLVDKATGKEFNGDYLNRLTVYTDKKTFYNAWDIDIEYPNCPKWKFKSTSRKAYIDGADAIMSFDMSYGKSKLTQKVILGFNKPYLEFVTDVEWHETNKMLRADFIPSDFSDKATFDIQFGNIERSTSTKTEQEWAQFEVAAHKFADVSSKDAGAAILSCTKYGFRVKDGLMSLNLLRSTLYPDDKADRGKHHFRYGYYPHLGGCFDAEVPKWSYIINFPPVVMNGDVKTESAATFDKRNIVTETIKPAENGKGIVLRIYENEGKNTSAKFVSSLPYKKMYLCDMLENPQSETGLELDFEPYEIKTVLLK